LLSLVYLFDQVSKQPDMKQWIFLVFLSFGIVAQAQHMNNETLGDIITQKSDTIAGIAGNWQFVYKELPMMCVTDQKNNRMRIIAPITESSNLDKDLLLDTMTANFHSALDVKYAISNGILWSAYVHPLKELSTERLLELLFQVQRYFLAVLVRKKKNQKKKSLKNKMQISSRYLILCIFYIIRY